MKRIVSLIAWMIMIIYSMPLFAGPFSADDKTKLLMHFNGNLA